MDLVDPAGVPTEGTIGVVVSGGFDSSILWHIVYGICLERGQKCIPFTVPKNDGALNYATRMLDWSWQRYGGMNAEMRRRRSKGWWRSMEVELKSTLAVLTFIEACRLVVYFLTSSPFAFSLPICRSNHVLLELKLYRSKY